MDPVRSAFARLRELQHGIPAPPGLEPVPLHLGESRLAAPAVGAALPADPAGWTRYPQPGGTRELRTAYRGWLERRFGVPHSAGGTIGVEPTPGTKQAVAVAIERAVHRARRRARPGAGEPAVVMPNPFYPTYRAATVAAGARPVFYRLDGADGQERGSGPRSGPVEAAVEEAGGSVAAILLCNPGNPRGEILSEGFLRTVAKTASATDALLLVDECYTDLSHGRQPPGYLSLVVRAAVEPAPFLVLHSLSKRSAAPGLRSGFVAGDPDTVAAYAHYNRECGVSTPLPVCAAAAALWRDEAHVTRAQKALAANWRLADGILGGVPGYRRPEAGFFLWLPVADDEATARRLWHEQALSVMPGRYLAADGPDGANPGSGHLRIALVHDEPLTRTALLRLRDALTPGDPAAGATSASTEQPAGHRPIAVRRRGAV